MRLTKPVKQAQLHDSLGRLFAAYGTAGPVTAGVPGVGPRERRRARILVAEDNVVNQKVVLLQLRQLGYSADSVADGAVAVEALARFAYDIVLMDCQMPQLDGYEASRLIRQVETGGRRRVPIIAMTAHAMSGDRARCLEAGMDDYLSKPVKAADLDAILARWDVARSMPTTLTSAHG